MATTRKTLLVGNGAAITERDRFTVDVRNTGLADIRRMMIALVGNETAAQVRLDNPPTITEVDNRKGRPVSGVQRKVVVLFGTSLAVAVLEKLRGMLAANVAASTNAITGKLSDPASWEIRHIRNGRTVPLGNVINFGPSDFVLIRPRSSIWYASAANKRVASGARSLEWRAPNARKGKTAKRNQGLGFMAMTARQARAVPELVPYSVLVKNTRAYAVSGEVRKAGTAYLMIVPRRRRQYRG